VYPSGFAGKEIHLVVEIFPVATALIGGGGGAERIMGARRVEIGGADPDRVVISRQENSYQ